MKRLKSVIYLSELASHPKKRRRARGPHYASTLVLHKVRLGRMMRNRKLRRRARRKAVRA